MRISLSWINRKFIYFKCPDNGKDYKIFGDSHIEQIAENYGIDILAKYRSILRYPKLAIEAIETHEEDWLEPAVERISKGKR